MEENYSILDRQCRRCKKSPAKYEKVGTWCRRVCQDCRTEYKAEWWQHKEQCNARPNRFALLERACNKCDANPAWFEKHPSASDGYRRACVECMRTQRKEHRNLPSVRSKAAGYMKEWSRVNNPLLKMEAFSHYGGAFCKCCGEDLLSLLTLDHVESTGAAHRRETKATGLNMYRWAKKNNWPPIFQVLCFNCNCGRAFSPDKICPHETMRAALLAA